MQAARQGDANTTKGTIITTCNNVFINGKPVARLGDTFTIPKPTAKTKTQKVAQDSKESILEGSVSVRVGGKPLARVGDKTSAIGVDNNVNATGNNKPNIIETGSNNVRVG